MKKTISKALIVAVASTVLFSGASQAAQGDVVSQDSISVCQWVFQWIPGTDGSLWGEW